MGFVFAEPPYFLPLQISLLRISYIIARTAGISFALAGDDADGIVERFRRATIINEGLRQCLVCLAALNLFSSASDPITASRPSFVAELYRISGYFVISHLAAPLVFHYIPFVHSQVLGLFPFLRRHRDVVRDVEGQHQHDDKYLSFSDPGFLHVLWADATLGNGSILALCAAWELDLLGFMSRIEAFAWRGLSAVATAFQFSPWHILTNAFQAKK